MSSSVVVVTFVVDTTDDRSKTTLPTSVHSLRFDRSRDSFAEVTGLSVAGGA
jgi:hypothetical protein